MHVEQYAYHPTSLFDPCAFMLQPNRAEDGRATGDNSEIFVSAGPGIKYWGVFFDVQPRSRVSEDESVSKEMELMVFRQNGSTILHGYYVMGRVKVVFLH